VNAAVDRVTPGVAEVLARCRQAGVKLALDGARLRILPPDGGIEETLLAALRARKAEIVAALEQVRAQAASPVPPPPVRAIKGARLPLAHGQENMWLGEEFGAVADMSNLTVLIELRGPLHVPALQRALTMLSERHLPLRTSLPEDAQGKPFQQVREAGPVPLARAAYRPEALHDAHNRAFDLKRDLPLRALLLDRAEDDHVLVLTVHHVASDGWSVGVMLAELGPLYDAACSGQAPAVPALPLDYGDYTLWQKNCEDSAWFARGLEHWRERLANPPRTHALPLDRSRPAAPSFAAARVAAHLDAATLAALENCAREQGSTLFVLLLSAFGVLVHRFGGDEDLLIGTPIANRQREEFAPLIGLFMNVLVSRLQPRADESFTALLARVNRRYREDIEYQGIPIERLEEEAARGEGGRASRLVQLSFALQNNELPPLRMRGLECRTEFRLPQSTTYDLNVNAWQSARGLELDFQYATALFDAPRIGPMVRAFTTLLSDIARAPSQKIARLALLTPAEQTALLALGNDTAAPYPEELGFHHLFEATAARQPEKVALRFGDQAFTYRQINERANRLASWLVNERGAAPDQLIGVCLERSPELLVSLLAVAKSGAGYLPLDPAFPRARLAYMVGQCEARTVLATGTTLSALDVPGEKVVRLDDPATRARIATASGDNASPAARRHSPDNLCYVIYTSGSTGNPKGVMIEHRGFTNFLHAFCREPGIGPDDAVLAIATSSFDIHTVELFCTLVSGGTVIMASQSEYSDPSALVRLMDAHAVTVAQATPTTWLGIVDTGWRPSRPLKAFVGGEALQDSLRDRLLAMEQLTLWNLYGPTETTVWCCARRVQREVLIGTPIANQRFYVLDAEMQPVPLGVEADLYIAGDGMGRGYIANPELTARAYLTDIPPHLGESCLYRTGDRVSRRAGGELCFHGRRDNQVKVNGFRIETGEIVTAIESQPEVRQAAVVVRKRANQANYLAAFVIAGNPGQADELVAALPARLQRTLPHYMVPAYIVAVTSLPKTPTGKLDLKLLSEQPLEAQAAPAAAGSRAMPMTPMQVALAGLWSDLLSLQPDALALDDDVIAAGADSIRVMMFVGRARKQGIAVSAPEVYGAPTVRALAALVADRRVEEHAATALYNGPAPLLADQAMALADEQVWRRFYINFIFDLPAPLDLELLQQAFEALARTHDALRARFQVENGRPTQRISADIGRMVFAETLACGWDDARMPEELRAATDRLHARLSPETGPLLAAAQICDPQGQCKLLFAVSHLVADGFSMVLLLEGLIEGYAALRRGTRPSQANPLPIDTWAPRYREYVNSDAFGAQLDFWESRAWQRVLPLPRDREGANIASSSRSVGTKLDAATTQLIHAELPRQLGMSPRDLITAALARVLMRWSGGDAIALHLHDAGRKDLEAVLNCDFSRVVGAFSVRHCVFLERTEASDVLGGIRGLHEQMARTPHGGAGLLPLRSVCERQDISARARRIPDAEVWFNYLGAVSERLFSDEGPDAEIPSRLSDVVRHIQAVTHEAGTARGRVFSLAARVSNGCLQLHWEYSAALHREETVQALAQELISELERIAAAAARR
jgi:amino acid adenylation domain-containing protein/non-ribosomal peptide synthase protein (TIGR01720 family)